MSALLFVTVLSMLKCTKCDTEKPTSEFYRYKAKKMYDCRDGYTYWCKQCYKKNYDDNRERQLRSNAHARYKRRYGLTLDEYNELISKGCSACGNRARGRIVMDHCHSTNAVRAPLCDGCNRALGCVADDPSILRNLADYLERHTAVHT